MANILYAGELADDGKHDKILRRLMKDHEVMKVDFLGLIMASQVERARSQTYIAPEIFREIGGANADIVLYDASLGYGQVEPFRRANLFQETGIQESLEHFKKPVVVFTRGNENQAFSERLRVAKFTQVKAPYDVSEVVKTIEGLL